MLTSLNRPPCCLTNLLEIRPGKIVFHHGCHRTRCPYGIKHRTYATVISPLLSMTATGNVPFCRFDLVTKHPTTLFALIPCSSALNWLANTGPACHLYQIALDGTGRSLTATAHSRKPKVFRRTRECRPRQPTTNWRYNAKTTRWIELILGRQQHSPTQITNLK